MTGAVFGEQRPIRAGGAQTKICAAGISGGAGRISVTLKGSHDAVFGTVSAALSSVALASGLIVAFSADVAGTGDDTLSDTAEGVLLSTRRVS